MADKDEYHGWTNRVTWLVKLHLDNTQVWQEHCLAVVATTADDAPGNGLSARLIQEYAEKLVLPTFLNNDRDRFSNDVLLSALADVNWLEIAKHYREELA